MVITLRNVCENCIRISEEEKYRQLHMFVMLWKKWKKLIDEDDKPKRENAKTVLAPENIAAVAESVCEAPSTSIHRRSQQLKIAETLV